MKIHAEVVALTTAPGRAEAPGDSAVRSLWAVSAQATRDGAEITAAHQP